MSTPSTAELSQTTVEHLQRLVQANTDSVLGFRDAAERIDDRQVAELFRSLATDRAQFADQLSQFVAMNSRTPQSDGTWLASLHRTWINLKSLVTGGDATAILVEAERGEDHIKAAYETALKETAGSPLNQTLLSQYKVVKDGHDRVRDLRDQYKARQ